MEQANTKETNNKRIAKNTVFLYIRMALSMLVSLYTSRVVLQTLGVEDFGIYSLVGGIVVVFQFLNSSLAGATSRFLTFELGKGDLQRLKDTFSTAMTAHLLMATFVFIVAETAGLWFISTQLVIPEGRMFAAHIVYQCSVFSLMVSFTQVPYNASIISHENMDVFAYIELLSVFLRLGIVYLLVIGNFDKLILYAILVLLVSMLIAITYRVYAIRHYDECRFHLIWKPEILKPMLTFSGWNVYSSASSSVRQFGTNSVINIFCGVVYNAASGIATTVHGTVGGFCSNVITAFRPQIIKQYAQGRISEMVTLLTNASKYSILLYLTIAIPLMIELPLVLELWLTTVPEKTVEFVRLLIISSIPFSLKETIKIAIHATGRIKLISMADGTLSLLVMIPIFFFLREGYDVEYVYVWVIIQRLLSFFCACYILKKQITEFPLMKYLVLTCWPIFLAGALGFTFLFTVHNTMKEGFIRLSVVSVCSVIFFATFTYLLCGKTTRREINSIIKQTLNKFSFNNE